jgi:hypothetical protein
MFSSFLESRKMVTVQKPDDCENLLTYLGVQVLDLGESIR